jgi:type I restriction enzyme, R subunit
MNGNRSRFTSAFSRGHFASLSLTCRRSGDQVKKQRADFFANYAPEAREILDDLVEEYAADGELHFPLRDVLEVPPISQHGIVDEIISKFGGPVQLRNTVDKMDSLLYSV